MCGAAPAAARLLAHCGWDFCAGPRAAVALPNDDLGALFRTSPAPFEGSPALLRGRYLSPEVAAADEPGQGDAGEELGPSGSEEARAAKRVILDALANLACNLTASEGKDKLLSAQRDFATLKAPPQATAPADSGESGSAVVAQPLSVPRVHVLAEGAFYAEAFRAALCGSHLAVDHRRLVHHLFRNASFAATALPPPGN
jgi:hypothetical protein